MKPSFAAAALAASVSLAAPAGAEVLTWTFICERGVEVPVTYATDEGDGIAVLNVEGRQITLMAEISGSGARYGWPSDGSHYVWWEHQGEATLYWADGETGEEVAVLSHCAPA